MKDKLSITSLNTAKRKKRQFDAIISIEDPGMRHPLRFHRKPHPDQLVLRFEDLDFFHPMVAPPDPRHVEAALEFARQHEDGRLLIHCRAGIARSTALALAVIADRLGPGREDEAVATLLEIRPPAHPNLQLLPIIDRVLDRHGAVENAWLRVEEGDRARALHRHEKRVLFEKAPHLYAPPMHTFEMTVSRFSAPVKASARPHSA